jgi:hypothetical protein
MLAIGRLREHTGVFTVQFSMRKKLSHLRLVFPGSLAMAMLVTACATEKPTVTATTDTKITADTAIPVYYETAEKLMAMPPCKATVEHVGTYWSGLRTVDGTRFCIGSPGATQEVRQFLETLNKGQTYDLPNAFFDYQKRRQQ